MSDSDKWKPYIESVINYVPIALAFLSSSGVVICANRQFEQFFPEVNMVDNFVELLGDTPERNVFLSKMEDKSNNFRLEILGNNLISTRLIFKKADYQEGEFNYTVSAKRKYIPKNGPLIQQLINSIPDIIFIKGLDSKFILVNKGFAKTLGFKKPEDIVGKTDFDFYPECIADKYVSADKRIVKTGQPELNKQEEILVGSLPVWYSTTKIPLFDEEGEVQGILGIGKDISDLVKKGEKLEKALEEAKKADLLKSKFLMNLSHEIRTPLNGILGFTQFLKNKNYDKSKQDKYLDIIYNNGKQLLVLISDIIDVSMIESNQITISEQVFRLNPLFENMKISFQNEVEQHEKEIELNNYLGLPDEEDYIKTDSYRLQQVLSNLLNNAIKFTSKGKIEFGYISTDKFIKFYVKDSGIGISKKDQEKIFLRFRQVDESETRIHGGAGLGLSICTGLIERLGGKVWVESKKNVGSTFYFTIPK